MNTTAINATATKADAFAARKGAPSNLRSIANLIRHAKGASGLHWIAENCEAQAPNQDRDDHAAQYRVIAKRLRRAIAA